MRKTINRWIILIGVCLVFSCTLLPSSEPSLTPTTDAILEAKTSNVYYRTAGTADQLVDQGVRLNAKTDDGVNVDPGGEALLSFGDYLQVRIFRDSNLSLESTSQIDPNAPPVAQARLLNGTTFNTASPQALAGQRVQITTDYATIVATGTEFLVYYNAATQETWVVVNSGTVEVTANGATVAVQPHWQTWVEPNAVPLPPVPAHRIIIGNRFQLVDALTNGALKDTDLLGDALAQCTTNAETPILVTAAKGAEVAKVMAANAVFVPLSRTLVAGSEIWLHGRDAQGAQGWVPSSIVHCGFDIGLLAEEKTPPTLTPSPTITPTPSVSITPTQTLQVGITPTVKPSLTKPVPTPIISALYVGISIGGVGPGGVFQSTNGNGKWTNSGLTSYHVSSLAIDPQNPHTIYAGTDGGIFKSTNGGENWSAENSGLTNLSVLRTDLAINPQTPSTLYLGKQDGVFKSMNGGENWTGVNLGLGNNPVIALAINPQSPTTLYATEDSLGGVFKSMNGGGNWSIVNTGIPNTATSTAALAIDPKNPSTLYVGTDEGVFKSTTGGGNWTAVNSGLTDNFIYALAIDPQTPSTLYVGTDSGVFKSMNGGGKWTIVNSGLVTSGVGVYYLAIDPRNPSTIYAGKHDGVFKSTNGGGKWGAINSGLVNAIVSMAISP